MKVLMQRAADELAQARCEVAHLRQRNEYLEERVKALEAFEA